MENGSKGELAQLSVRRHVPHYHGDETRALFLISALILVVFASLGVDLPLSVSGAVTLAVLLVVAAGITNPMQRWIHYVNAILAIGGSLLFGITAVEHYRSGGSVIDTAFASIEALALLSLFSLYFTVRTIRGIMLRPILE